MTEQMVRINKEHTPGSIAEMLAIALPMVISYAAETIMTFTDRMFLSKLAPEIMNAAMGGGLTAFMMSTFFMGLIGYSTALVAQYLGANRKNSCPTVTTQALIIALISYPVVLLMKPLAYRLFELTHVPAAQLGYQIEYFNILIYGAIIGLIRTALTSYFSGIGKTKIVMFSMITTMLVNVFMNYILIFGKFGIPAMGIRGAAIGTLTGGFVGILILFAAYFGKKNRLEFHVMKSFRLSAGSGIHAEPVRIQFDDPDLSLDGQCDSHGDDHHVQLGQCILYSPGRYRDRRHVLGRALYGCPKSGCCR
jgi:MATE family multidrug resistance protein